VIKAVIFDVDGVLVDSREANVTLVKKLMVTAGYPEPSDEEVSKAFHMPILLTFQMLAGTTSEEDTAKARAILEDGNLRDEVAKLYQFPLSLEAYLEKLHQKYKLGIATSRMRIGMGSIFTSRQIEHLFDAVVTFDDVKKPKPHPEALLLAAKTLSVSPDEAIYIGDGHSDIEAAKSAGMKSIHISRTPHPDAHAVIEEFDQLMEAIESLL
jgi:HAD superfamily hydrolase (TIGR01509 family)